MKDTALAFRRGRQACEQQGKTLHHTGIVGLTLGKIVRHEQQLWIVALQLVRGSTREFFDPNILICLTMSARVAADTRGGAVSCC